MTDDAPITQHELDELLQERDSLRAEVAALTARIAELESGQVNAAVEMLLALDGYDANDTREACRKAAVYLRSRLASQLKPQPRRESATAEMRLGKWLVSQGDKLRFFSIVDSQDDDGPWLRSCMLTEEGAGQTRNWEGKATTDSEAITAALAAAEKPEAEMRDLIGGKTPSPPLGSR